jgi:glycerophosphoryl diester phosphodiesterase
MRPPALHPPPLCVPRAAPRRATLCLALCAARLLAANPAEPSASSPPAPGWTICGHIPPERFVIQSHRGAGELAPENTLEAFELGWTLGTVPEADVRTTRDGVIVAFHDANFKRVVKNPPPELANKGVADVTFAELSRLDVGAWKGEQFLGRRVCRIADVFERMRGRPERRLYLDIKNVELPSLAALVREHDVPRQVILASPQHDVIRHWKRLVPESDTLLWMGGAEDQLRPRLAQLRAAGFEGITQLQVHVRLTTNAAAEPFNLSRDFLRATGEELRARGILYQALPWGVAEPRVYWQLLDLGLMSFATDHPDVTTRAVRDYCARRAAHP